MITTLIVLGSIFSYFMLGMVICRPSLKPLYASTHNYLTRTNYRNHDEPNPDLIARQVIMWYTFIAAFWPLTFIWVMCWIYGRPRIPQYRAHLEEKERKRLEKELAEANRTIEEFSNRNNPPAQTQPTLNPYEEIMSKLRKHK